MKVALITGSCGLVGSESALFFSKKGFEIVGIENNARRFFFGRDGDTSWIKSKLKSSIRKYRHYNVDIRNYNSLKKIFRKFKNKISVIIHCACSLILFKSYLPQNLMNLIPTWSTLLLSDLACSIV